MVRMRTGLPDPADCINLLKTALDARGIVSLIGRRTVQNRLTPVILEWHEIAAHGGSRRIPVQLIEDTSKDISNRELPVSALGDVPDAVELELM